MTFEDLKLIPPLRLALADAGYTAPTPIQVAAIPALLAGRDLLGTAQTGTGKTAAFALPILQHLTTTLRTGEVRALVLAPTRELATQLGESFAAYGAHLPDLHCTVVFGGMGMRAQRRAIEAGLDILVATPGRLLDLAGQGAVRLDSVEHLVLDEADRMLDLGFFEAVRSIVKRLPKRRQNVLFSATMPPEIERLASQILRNPLRVQVAPAAAVADQIEQYVIFVEKPHKRAALSRVLADPRVRSAIVFVRTKHAADRLGASLRAAGVGNGVLHGDKLQPERERALSDFTRGFTRVLVATDVAARGIDIERVSHVINLDIPAVAESYVHRIGRTARAGESGVAISLCASEERAFLAAIERLTGQPLTPLR